MMRKIVAQGNQSITLTLPIKWVREQQLKAGDEVEVNQKGGELVIGKQGAKRGGKTTITLTQEMSNTKMLRSLILGAYRSGADEIEINFEPLELKDREIGKIKTIKYIQDSINQLIGVSIVEQTKNYVKIKDITGTSEEEFDNILRRTFLLVLSISEQSIKAFKEHDQEALEDVPLLYDSIRKFTEYCMRLLSKYEYKEHQNTSHYYSIITCLDDISDAYRHITKHFVKAKLSPQVIKAYEHHNQFIQKIQSWFYTPKEQMHQLFEIRDKAYISIDEAEKQTAKNPQEGAVLEALHSMRDATTYIIRERMAMMKEF